MWDALWNLPDGGRVSTPSTSGASVRLRVGAGTPTRGRPGLAEPVAHRPHGLDEPGPFLAELGPEPADVHVDGPGPAVVLVAPDTGQQLLPREHLPRVRREEPQQLVLHVRQVQRAVAHGRLVRLEVQHEVSVLDDLGSARAPGAPSQMTQPRLELPGMERREAEVVEDVLAHLQL